METTDTLNMKVEDMPISSNLKNAFRINGIVTLQNILDTDYKRILKIRNIGEKYIDELKSYVHELGYELLNEEESISKKVERFRKNGVILLEDYGWPTYLYNLLYQNGIYTLDDLKKKKDKIFEIKNFGPKRKEELERKLLELGISLYEKKENQEESVVVVDGRTLDSSTLQKLVLENVRLQGQIAKKQAMIANYKRLMAEREALLKSVEELDEKIKECLESSQEFVQGANYVRTHK